MAVSARELYHSPNGDRWYLARDPDTARVFIRREANLPSGGHVSEIGIAEFLNQGMGPEQQELLRLIGTLMNGTVDGPGRRPRRARARGKHRAR